MKKETKNNSPTHLAFDLKEEKSVKDSDHLFIVIDKSVFLEVTENNIDYTNGLLLLFLLLFAVHYAFHLQYDDRQIS